MGNIDTYVQQNAEDPVSARPLSDVDKLVLCYLVYYDFAGIVPSPEEGGSITIREAARLYDKKHGTSQSNVDAPFLQHIAASERFGEAELAGYEEKFVWQEIQYAAIRTVFPGGVEVITFRGVNETLTGWQESFGASYQVAPSQELAKAYLERCVRGDDRTYFVGGHSKGGNLALYAAAHCAATVQDRIREITLFDGPGLTPTLFDESKYEKIRDRIRRILPQFSLIGRLFFSEPETRSVVVDAKGPMQHEPLYWRVEDGDFVDVKEPDPEGLRLAKMFKNWIARTNMKERRSFTADLFRIARERRVIDLARNRPTGPAAIATGAVFGETKKRQKREIVGFAIRSYFRVARATRSALRKLLFAYLASRIRKAFGRKQTGPAT